MLQHALQTRIMVPTRACQSPIFCFFSMNTFLSRLMGALFFLSERAVELTQMWLRRDWLNYAKFYLEKAVFLNFTCPWILISGRNGLRETLYIVSHWKHIQSADAVHNWCWRITGGQRQWSWLGCCSWSSMYSTPCGVRQYMQTQYVSSKVRQQQSIIPGFLIHNK